MTLSRHQSMTYWAILLEVVSVLVTSGRLHLVESSGWSFLSRPLNFYFLCPIMPTAPDTYGTFLFPMSKNCTFYKVDSLAVETRMSLKETCYNRVPVLILMQIKCFPILAVREISCIGCRRTFSSADPANVHYGHWNPGSYLPGMKFMGQAVH